MNSKEKTQKSTKIKINQINHKNKMKILLLLKKNLEN